MKRFIPFYIVFTLFFSVGYINLGIGFVNAEPQPNESKSLGTSEETTSVNNDDVFEWDSLDPHRKKSYNGNCGDGDKDEECRNRCNDKTGLEACIECAKEKAKECRETRGIAVTISAALLAIGCILAVLRAGPGGVIGCLIAAGLFVIGQALIDFITDCGGQLRSDVQDCRKDCAPPT